MVYLFESFELDEESFCLTQAGRRVALEPKSLRVLLLLVQSGGKLVEKDTILSSVWKDTFVEEKTLTRAIALIRKQLDDDPRQARFIETVPTLGYRFIAPVETRSGSDSQKVALHDGTPKAAEVLLLDPAPVGQQPTLPRTSIRLRLASALFSSRFGKTGSIMVAVLLAATLGAAFVAWRYETVEPPVLRYTLQMPEGASLDWASLPAISPDGRFVVAAAQVGGKRGLWLRGLHELNAHLLPGTDSAALPFWSPDSRWIGFLTFYGKLRKVSVDGGLAVTLCDASARRMMGAAWSKQDLIVFGSVAGLSLVPATGGTPKLLTTPPDAAAGEIARRSPWFLPDGRHFLYTSRNDDPQKTRVYVDSIDARPGSETRREVLQAASNAIYVPMAHPGLAGRNRGYLLFARNTLLMAQPFDASALRTTGEPVPVAEGVDYVSQYAQSEFSVSQNGILVYTSGAGVATEVQLTWLDRTGKPVGTVGSPGMIDSASISRDSSKVAAVRLDASGSWDIWLHDLARGTASRLTFGTASNEEPVWSPDGSKIAFDHFQNGIHQPWQKETTGANQEEVLSKDPQSAIVSDWSPDGRYLIESVGDPKIGYDVWAVPTFGDKKPFQYIAAKAVEADGKLSPGGRFLAYSSRESNRTEIYVQTFPEHGGKWQISTGGGAVYPIWSRDGRELYFLSLVNPISRIMAVEVKADGSRLQAGAPRALFSVPRFEGSYTGYDVSKDGRFLVQVPQKQAAASVPLTVIVNWQSALRK